MLKLTQHYGKMTVKENSFYPKYSKSSQLDEFLIIKIDNYFVLRETGIHGAPCPLFFLSPSAPVTRNN